MSDEGKSVEGIGGWLILVVLGLIINPIRVAYFLFSTQAPIFSDGVWDALTTPGSEVYHALWAPLLVFEIIGNIGTIALAVLTLWHLLKKSRRTPFLAISWLSWMVTFVVIDFFAGDLIPAVAAQNDPESKKELFRGILGAAIWIPYFLVSKRVKATFVH